jgi:glutathione S-transferase
MPVTVYGPAYSTYTRTVRLVLEEKGAPYELVEVDLLKGETKTPAHLARNPFAKVPTLDHDGFPLYETGAIVRYLDRVLPGPRLTPEDPRLEARMNQIVGIVDAHAYPNMVTKLFIQRVVMPMMGDKADEAAIGEAMPTIKTSLDELERLVGGDPFAAGPALSLADLHLAPVFAYLVATPESGQLLANRANLNRWWQSVSARESVRKTEPKLG